MQFREGSFIEVGAADGRRILGRVTESGMDYVTETCACPLPILESPILIGDVDSLRQRVRRTQPNQYAQFSALSVKLIAECGLEGFSLIRALHWAADGGDFTGKDGLNRTLQAALAQPTSEVKHATLVAA